MTNDNGGLLSFMDYTHHTQTNDFYDKQSISIMKAAALEREQQNSTKCMLCRGYIFTHACSRAYSRPTAGNWYGKPTWTHSTRHCSPMGSPGDIYRHGRKRETYEGFVTMDDWHLPVGSSPRRRHLLRICHPDLQASQTNEPMDVGGAWGRADSAHSPRGRGAVVMGR